MTGVGGVNVSRVDLLAMGAQFGPKGGQSDTPFTGEYTVLRRPTINTTD
jgi:hypothetical protein